MAERFIKLFQLSNALSCNDTPIIVSAGVLLHDTETGCVVAQLKFQSVSPKRIKAIKVSLSAYDVSNVQLQGVSEYQYLDLNLTNGDEFGTNKAIVMPADITRSFSLDSIIVVFNDGST